MRVLLGRKICRKTHGLIGKLAGKTMDSARDLLWQSINWGLSGNNVL